MRWPHITRRDFLEGLALGGVPTALAAAEPMGPLLREEGQTDAARASAHHWRDHPSAYQQQPIQQGDQGVEDLVVVGAGLSGLAAAWWYQQQARRQGQEPRILLLDAGEHLGGHAHRNEFISHSGERLWGYGGSQSLDGPSLFSPAVHVCTFSKTPRPTLAWVSTKSTPWTPGRRACRALRAWRWARSLSPASRPVPSNFSKAQTATSTTSLTATTAWREHCCAISTRPQCPVRAWPAWFMRRSTMPPWPTRLRRCAYTCAIPWSACSTKVPSQAPPPCAWRCWMPKANAAKSGHAMWC
ncbi:MAG: hypothetical protein C4K60_14445 [Ideonella sp. MAG2]|nr:MAG: hypothetical protein C4K60_14445 [Ideonella sp. MAG2]